jgi:hypothetical protein
MNEDDCTAAGKKRVRRGPSRFDDEERNDEKESLPPKSSRPAKKVQSKLQFGASPK